MDRRGHYSGRHLMGRSPRKKLVTDSLGLMLCIRNHHGGKPCDKRSAYSLGRGIRAFSQLPELPEIMGPHPYNVLRIAGLPERRWRNAGGMTRMLASGNGWRVSLASIGSNGQFSIFPGTQRHSGLLEGGPVALRAAHLSRLLETFTVAQYRGDLAWECGLEGAQASVLNVICETAHATANVETGGELSFTSGGLFSVLLAVNCPARCMNNAMDSPVVVPQGHVLVCDKDAVTWTCSSLAALPALNGSSLVGIRIHAPETTNAQKND